jgi:hypothetical protein
LTPWGALFASLVRGSILENAVRITLTALTACFLATLVAYTPAAGDEKKARPPEESKPESLQIVQTIKTKATVATALAFSPDGQVLAVADGVEIRFWNPRTGKEAANTWKFDDLPLMTFVNPETVAVYVETVRAISLRAYPSGTEVISLALGKEDAVRRLVATGGVIAHDGGGASMRVWGGPKWRDSWRVDWDATDAPYAIAISPDRSEVAVSGGTATLRVYAAKDGKLLRNAGKDKLVSPHVLGLAYSPDGRAIALSPVTRDHPLTRDEDGAGLAILDADLSKHRALVQWGSPSGNPIGCLFTPDGKTLVVPTHGATVRLYEVETGTLRHVGGVVFNPFRFAMSPDGRLFAVAAGGKDVSIVDWRAAKPGTILAEPALEGLWADLASPDSAKGFKAIVALGADPGKAAKLIGDKLRPVPVPKAEAVKTWVTDLGSEEFATRAAAEKELAKLGDAIEAALQTAAKSDSNDRRASANRLLAAATRRNNPERLRALRAVEVLEYIGTPAGRDVLKTLSGGAPSALLTRDAKAALARLRAAESKP